MISIALAIVTALLSSACTWLIAWAFFKFRLEKQVDQLKAEIGQEVEERVRAGALQAGEELLPRFRNEVREGFLDAMKSWPSSGVVSEAARNVAKTGADILGAGFDNLLKPRPRRWR